ncbi:TrbI/VirB10 family protein [Morganella morganii]|uniref:TrbI/VirB10 family protein n=1 Tax=Morganella morganii TaxID=582 RepID=UPI0034B7D9F2
MAVNINSFVRKNQNKLFAIILVVAVIAVAAVFYINKKASEPKAPKADFEDEVLLEPDLTGAVSNTFDNKVDAQILTDSQTMARENKQAVAEMTRSYNEVQNKLKEKDKEVDELKKRLDELELQKISSAPVAPAPVNQPPLSDDNESTIERITRGTSAGNTTPQQRISYSAPVPVAGQLETKTFSYRDPAKESKAKERFYIPTGSFSNAIILEGADANAAVTAKETDTSPMQFKLTGQLHLPSNQRSDKLENCFVTAATYGDISSERAIVRLQRLSCVINGKHIDTAVKGHVSFYGKNGIKGIPVMRNGQILGLAFTSGTLGGFGSAISQIGQTTVGIGAEHTVSAGEVAQQAAGKGMQSAANKLADYYIALAEQYHPIIPIGSANRVEVVFQEGFWAEFLEDKESQEQPGEMTADGSLQTDEFEDNSDLPPELVNQLGNINNGQLDEFVAPNNKRK